MPTLGDLLNVDDAQSHMYRVEMWECSAQDMHDTAKLPILYVWGSFAQVKEAVSMWPGFARWNIEGGFGPDADYVLPREALMLHAHLLDLLGDPP